MPPAWNVKPPNDDNEYLSRLTKTIFSAGLNWGMVDKKWPNFEKAFSGFAPAKVSRLTEKDVKGLMNNQEIIRNERKIRATVSNGNQFLQLEKGFGSFRKYLDSFQKDEKRLQDDLQERFQHVGSSTARMFLWSVGYPLTPNADEKKWMRAADRASAR